MHLTDHDYFPPGNLDPRFNDWSSTSPILLQLVSMAKGHLTPLHTFTIHKNLVHGPMEVPSTFKYRQISTTTPAVPVGFNPGGEFLLVEDQPPDKPISYFYQALLSMTSAAQPTFLATWQLELQSPLSETRHSTILQLTHVSSISSKAAEVTYKMLTRWHYTPAVLHRIFLSLTDLCWRGCGEQTTHAHIWWSCPHIRPALISCHNHHFVKVRRMPLGMRLE